MQQLPNYLLRSHHRHHLEGHHGGFMEYCTKLDSLQYYIFHTELLPEMCKPKTVTQTHSSNFTLSSTNHHYLHHYTLHQRHLRGHSTDLITTMHQNHFSSDKHAIANSKYTQKDPSSEQERLCAVYRIPCTNCPKAYKGQTSRTLAQWKKEHQRSVRYSDIATSILAEHSNSTGHPIQWDEAHVIDTYPHTSRWCLLESWAIHKEPNPLNRWLGSLPHSYKTLIKHS